MTQEERDTVAKALRARAQQIELTDGGSRRSKQAAKMIRVVAVEVEMGQHG